MSKDIDRIARIKTALNEYSELSSGGRSNGEDATANVSVVVFDFSGAVLDGCHFAADSNYNPLKP
ncbi:hypothetical protein [Azorhizobium doebereinerae]|uniref:hypothetical protein n=1 Tax=Azorhizobium doebereinerae TaxID=281091 RepID=UPI0012EBB141|nr:hypothetical protein [Azorhizobium doebereinerae]